MIVKEAAEQAFLEWHKKKWGTQSLLTLEKLKEASMYARTTMGVDSFEEGFRRGVSWALSIQFKESQE